MYDVNIKVNADGTISAPEKIVRLGTESEISRTRLVFDIHESIEGTIRYVKFVHKKASFLQRVLSSNTLIVPTNVCRYPGRWFISFISSDKTITGSQITGSYAYISEPYEAVVVEGIFNTNNESYEAFQLKSIIEGSIDTLVVPQNVRQIGSYFLSGYPSNYAVELHEDIQSINTHAFKESNITSITFGEDGILSSIKDHAFQKTERWKSGVVIPRSVSYWGQYAFNNSNVPSIEFETGSSLRTLPTYAFYNLKNITRLELPVGFMGFSGQGQTISGCESLETLKLPNTISIPIVISHIRANNSLSNIVLEREWNCSANFAYTDNLTASSIVAMFNALKDLSNQSAKTLTLGPANLAKVTSSQIAIATSKNWTVS